MKPKYIAAITVTTIAAAFFFFYYFEVVVPEKQAAAAIVAQEAARDRIKQCFINMYDNYSDEWDKQCQLEGMQPDCDLPLAVTAPIETRHRDGQEQCIQIYK